MTVIFDDRKLADCLCEDCPSYPKQTFPKGSGVFCATGPEGTIRDRKGCVCRRCPVYGESAITGSFFCIDGPAD